MARALLLPLVLPLVLRRTLSSVIACLSLCIFLGLGALVRAAPPEPGCVTKSVVLVNCPAAPFAPASKPADATQATLEAARERLARQSLNDQARVQAHEAGTYDLERVVVEAQLQRKESASQVFDRVFNAPSALWRAEGRQAAGNREDRDNFGLRTECQGAAVFGCDSQPARAQTRRFKDGI